MFAFLQSSRVFAPLLAFVGNLGRPAKGLGAHTFEEEAGGDNVLIKQLPKKRLSLKVFVGCSANLAPQAKELDTASLPMSSLWAAQVLGPPRPSAGRCSVLLPPVV